MTQAARAPQEPSARALEQAILDLLETRAPGKTICPSDVARALGTTSGWRDLMEPTRQAASRLVTAGEVEITQGGVVVDLSTVTGPIRIRRVRAQERG